MTLTLTAVAERTVGRAGRPLQEPRGGHGEGGARPQGDGGTEREARRGQAGARPAAGAGTRGVGGVRGALGEVAGAKVGRRTTGW